MTPFEFGDVILVPFPFTDQTTTKQRPAVVISSPTYNTRRPDIVLIAVTSQIRASGWGDVEVNECAQRACSNPQPSNPSLRRSNKAWSSNVWVNYKPSISRQYERT